MEQKQPTKIPTPEELEAMMVVPAWLVHGTAFLLQVIIYGLPVVAIALPIMHSPGLWFTLGWLLLAPVLYAILFGTVAGVCSLPWQRGIIKGVFPRDVRFPIYAMRKLYGTCWTAVYYFKPIYTIILNVSLFKAIVFRLFGYKGSLNITIFPDTWIRDLPLLRIEEGAYIANRATLGTNICLRDGNILVGNVTVKKKAIMGHLSILGIGATVGEGTEVGLDIAIGLHTKIGKNSTIGTTSVVSHKVKIGDNTHIGVCSFIGTGAVLGDNLNLPSYSYIPDKAEVLTQSDVEQYVRKQPLAPQVVERVVYQTIPEKKPH